MKKQLKIALMSSALVLGGAGTVCACLGSSVYEKNVICVKAESEEVTEDVFTFEEENVVFTLILRSDYTFKLIIAPVDEEPTVGEGSYLIDGSIVTLVVNGRTMVVELDFINHLFSEYIETEEGKDVVAELEQKFANFKDNVLVPIFGGISITSVVTCLLTFLLNYLRNKKLDKKCVDSEHKLAEATAILATIKNIYADIQEDKKINNETKEFINSQMKALIEKIDKNNEIVGKIQKVEPILKLLCQLEIKLAKASNDVIASGALQDINEIATLIKDF